VFFGWTLRGDKIKRKSVRRRNLIYSGSHIPHLMRVLYFKYAYVLLYRDSLNMEFKFSDKKTPIQGSVQLDLS